ncbi:MBL fold metallo-hydrolase [Oceanicaulis sp. MMSF_3324]|uniref:MBL fold metallo-hydrolase n=1 Tax=Oceanicaulis sp. MMSF_3324 TaxID=3046702 RepID=UPI00273DFEC9|nr:MBL fold metallo-hydrolase [Oceanicaulis sp. MMSF_3324]
MSSGPVLRARILGSGSSGGVPRIDGDWGDCDPNNPRNRRSRCSLLVERAHSLKALEAGDATRLLIDTSPDLRQQMLDSGISSLDGVAFTHAHADQAHGIDDVRAFVYRRGAQLDAIMNPQTQRQLRSRFRYIFETPKGSGYPPLMIDHGLEPGEPAVIEGPGGEIELSLFDVIHGREPCSGIRIGPLAYSPDVNGLDGDAMTALSGASVWIVDALRDKPHPSHAHVNLALDWLAQIKPELGILTNLHIDLDYEELLRRLPNGVRPAYDGLDVTIALSNGAILDTGRL